MLRPTTRHPAPLIRFPVFLMVLATVFLALVVGFRLAEVFATRPVREIVEEPYPDTPTIVPEPSDRGAPPRIALVIDDLGNRWDNDVVRGLLTLDIPLTLGVIPGLDYSDRIAKAAHDHGETVIAHVPMKALYMDVGLGVPVIYENSTSTQVMSAMTPALNLSYAEGMNNHMGSEATQDARTMRMVAQVCRAKGWFILDSITHASSVLYAVAVQEGVPAARRDVFLDHERGIPYIESELAKAGRLARAQRRPIVVIGHPRPETWAVLQKEIPAMMANGIHFVPLTDALRPGSQQVSERTGRP